MELQHINVKIDVEGELQLDTQRIVETFHRWTSEQSLGELLIDVADYRHVPAGPAVVLIGLEADYCLDHSGHRWGLLYHRKASVAGSNRDRLRQAVSAAVTACQLLEAEFPGQLHFSRRVLEITVNDRALAPNTLETFQTVRPELSAFLNELGHPEHELLHDAEPRRRFGLYVKLAQPLDFDLVTASR